MKKLELNKVKEEVKTKKSKTKTEDKFSSIKKAEVIEMYKGLDKINIDQANIIESLEKVIEKRNSTITSKNNIIEANKLDYKSLLEQNNTLTNQLAQAKGSRDDWRAKANLAKSQIIDLEIDLKDFKEMSVFSFIKYVLKR